MRLIDFLKAIAGLALGFIVTGSIFAVGHVFMDDVLSGLKPDIFILTISAMIWLVVSYGVLIWVF